MMIWNNGYLTYVKDSIMRNKLFLLLFSLMFLSCAQQDSDRLQTFGLEQITLLESPFYQAQEASLHYILELDVDRLLAPFIKEAGLTPSAERYGNWENSGLDGHIGGHYLSALSIMYAATGNPELLRRLEYIIDWLARCQEAHGNGYVGGIPGGSEMWEEVSQGIIEAEPFSLNNRWVPWYNIHKLYAGLRDAYRIAGNEKAHDILVNLSEWCYNLLENLTREQIQEMLLSEHGGMNEIFVDVAGITGDDKYLDLADKFSHRLILDPLLSEENRLTGLHVNTQIPKVIGFQQYAEATNNQEWNRASEFFWDLIVDNWTVSIGGNSVAEHLHPADDFTPMISSNQGPETCNTYNMLRLSKQLFLSNPHSKYLDYYERAVYNHILSSKHPDGGYVYFTPMRPLHYRVYSQPHECFWCCVGTGLENHGKYGEMIYLHNNDDAFVNFFIPSILHWEEKGVTLTQNTNFPYDESTNFTFTMGDPDRFTLNIRIPEWVDKDRFTVEVNGELQQKRNDTGIYASIKRTWQDGDAVTVTLPMRTSIEYLPDGSPWASILHGPIVLAAITGYDDLDGLFADDSRWAHIAGGPYYPLNESPIIVTEDKDFAGAITRINGESMEFSISDILYYPHGTGISLVPFYNVHDARYVIYFPVTTEDGLDARLEELSLIDDEE